MVACSAHAQVGILAISHILPCFNSFAAFLKYTQKKKTIEGYLNSFPIEKKKSKQSKSVFDTTTNLQFSKMQNEI